MDEPDPQGQLTVKDWILGCPGGEDFAQAIEAVVAERRSPAPLDEASVRGLATADIDALVDAATAERRRRKEQKAR